MARDLLGGGRGAGWASIKSTSPQKYVLEGYIEILKKNTYPESFQTYSRVHSLPEVLFSIPYISSSMAANRTITPRDPTPQETSSSSAAGYPGGEIASTA